MKLALDFPRPQSVEHAERNRLSPEPGDASLVRDLRREAASQALYISELEADRRAQANIIQDFQMDQKMCEVAWFPFSSHATTLGDVYCIAVALINAGHEVHVGWMRTNDDAPKAITGIQISIADEAA